VTTVAPGYVETDMAARHLAGPTGDQIRAQSPFGRIAQPGEIAAAVTLLDRDYKKLVANNVK
jgi:3-oxoacyl-[acyl-carrier protein] reductase